MSGAPARRRALYALATSDRFEAAARRLPVAERAAWSRASRYVAGERFEDAAAVVARLRSDGIAAAVDLFGEAIDDAGRAHAAADAYVEVARRLPELGAGATLALDLSHIGLDVSTGLCRGHLERIAEAASPVRLDIGAEDHSRTDAALALAAGLARTGAAVQMTVQANLRRSVEDWHSLVAAGAAIRLVKGAYVEPPSVALRFGEETDLAYVRLAHAIHGAGAALALATHDRVLREALLQTLDGAGVEMLLGVRTDEARGLAGRGVPIRVYVPFGGGWFRYWMRRVAESQGAHR
jgi:proline dehydrogenase